jgi:tellurite resistance protein
MTPLLLNAARAFAMVGFADGRLAPAEAQRFAHLASKDAVLGLSGHADIADAWTQAAREVHAAESFGSALVTLRTEVTSDADKAVIMRTAQAAIVADGRVEPQEGKAIQMLAEALGLDPSHY